MNTRFCSFIYVGVNSFTSPPRTAFSYGHYRGYFIALLLQLRTLFGCPPRRTGSDVTRISITIFGFEMQIIVSSRQLSYCQIARCREGHFEQVGLYGKRIERKIWFCQCQRESVHPWSSSAGVPFRTQQNHTPSPPIEILKTEIL